MRFVRNHRAGVVEVLRSLWTGAVAAAADLAHGAASPPEPAAPLPACPCSRPLADTAEGCSLATILLHFLTNFLKFRESNFLDECNTYCQVHVTGKLKLTPDENG